MLPNAHKLTTALLLPNLQQLLFLLILNNASKRNAPTNGLLAKKTPNASQPSKIARRNAELSQAAGHSV
jgi:hypothetical protein